MIAVQRLSNTLHLETVITESEKTFASLIRKGYF